MSKYSFYGIAILNLSDHKPIRFEKYRELYFDNDMPYYCSNFQLVKISNEYAQWNLLYI